MFEKRLEVPEKGPADYLVGAIKVAAAALPWWAAPGVELAAHLFGTPIERRRDEFLDDFAWVVRETAAKVDDLQPENLSENEAFVSAAQQAARIAMSTHQREKREYLRNALLNIAIRREPSEEFQQIFLKAIEAFSVSHVKVLNVLWTGVTNLQAMGLWKASTPVGITDYAHAIGALHPELKSQDDLLRYIITDLRNWGMTNMGGPTDRFPAGGSQAITNMGVRFLRFVLSPENLPK